MQTYTHICTTLMLNCILLCLEIIMCVYVWVSGNCRVLTKNNMNWMKKKYAEKTIYIPVKLYTFITFLFFMKHHLTIFIIKTVLYMFFFFLTYYLEFYLYTSILQKSGKGFRELNKRKMKEKSSDYFINI